MVRWAGVIFSFVAAMTQGAPGQVEDVGPAFDPKVVEIRGVGAGELPPERWNEAAALNWLPDVRSPMIEPLPGAFRNIYAPSVVTLPDGAGWRVFYGGWDGVATGNDRIYSVQTTDFVTFRDRRVVVEHGPFQHVCNVSAIRECDGSFRLACTAYPDEKGLNKPVGFRIDGENRTVVAARSGLIPIDGYPDFAAADMNGMNVLVRDAGAYRLYFGDFRNFGRVYRASSVDGVRYAYDGVVADFAGMVNDVKRVGRAWLMALHRNGPDLFYSWSADPAKFPPPRRLAGSLGDDDRYMVAVGWVVSRDGKRVLGFLYGAGEAPSLDRNRIFARWLQRKVIFVTEDGATHAASRALGPDRAGLDVGGQGRGRIQVWSEDGSAKVWESPAVTLVGGRAYRMGR